MRYSLGADMHREWDITPEIQLDQLRQSQQRDCQFTFLEPTAGVRNLAEKAQNVHYGRPDAGRQMAMTT